MKNNATFTRDVEQTQKAIDSVSSKIIEALVKKNQSLTSENK